MPTLVDIIAKFTDYDTNKTDEGEIIADFLHKYKMTTVKINGFYRTIRSADNTYLFTTDEKRGSIEYKASEIKSLEKLMPATGLYASKYGLVYLTRLPQRQWLKSFCLDKNYAMLYLDNPTGEITVENTIFNPLHFDEETLIYNDNLYIGWKNVGKLVSKDKVFLVKPQFKEEIEELWPQLKITSEANSQPKYMDERLMLDF
jgi:hypothetical protein